MGKSYRRPYSAICGNSLAHDDKTRAARSVRRNQNQTLRDAISQNQDWDGFLLPDIYECQHNEVYGWCRDGNQYLQTQSSQYNNPYRAVSSPTWMSQEEIMKRWEESKERSDEWLKRVCR